MLLDVKGIELLAYSKKYFEVFSKDCVMEAAVRGASCMVYCT